MTDYTSVTTSKAEYRDRQGPFLPEVYFARFPYPYRSTAPTEDALVQETLDDIDRLFRHVVAPEDVAAFVLEPVQGEGGYIIPPRKWVAGLREICTQHGILLIVDEVQSGFGRTGQWFAVQTLEVEPDIVCMAKSIAGGFPLGAVGASRELILGGHPKAANEGHLKTGQRN